ncbi:MAG: hypothetical protein K2X34_00795 [Hyphomonadaceae bacterium]|nr:hypothetical protein [Hyphomonadaceae bacterium]
MANRTDLEAAAAAGVIQTAQVQPLLDFLTSRAAGPAGGVQALPGEENLRFIRNFHDVFLAIGIVLFAIGMAIGIGTYVASSPSPEEGTVLTGLLCAGAAAVMWGLGELFARRRRLFLPAIAIVLAMTVFTIVAGGTLYAGILLGRDFGESATNVEQMPPELRMGILIAVGLGVLAPLAFYLRFRLPFSLGLTGAAAAGFVVVVCMVTNFELTMQLLPALYLILGALLFLAGVAFDARDPERATRFSDNGFWLHFAAAPLILNGAFGIIGQALNGGDNVASGSAGMIVAAGTGDAQAAAIQAAATLVVILLLGLLSLLINRRALIVSALITAGIAIGVLMQAAGLGAGALAATTLIVLGAFVLILGAGWHNVRRALLGWVKPDGLWARVFPPETVGA